MSKREKTTKEKKLTKTYQFRLYPTRKQQRTFEHWLVLCCETYNAALDERKSAYKQFGNSFQLHLAGKNNRGILGLTKLGRVKMVQHRPIKGTPKTAIVKRTPTGKWFVSITVELVEADWQAKRLPPSEEAVGIDVGLESFAYLSTEEEIANPRFFREEEAKLARAQRKLSKTPKGTKEREKKRKIVARTHERIANRRPCRCGCMSAPSVVWSSTATTMAAKIS